MNVINDDHLDETSSNNSFIIPIGSQLTDVNNRTLFPYLGTLAYDKTTQMCYIGSSTIWNAINTGGPSIFSGFSNISTGDAVVPHGGITLDFGPITAVTDSDNFSVGINGSVDPTVINATGYYHVTAQATFDISGILNFPKKVGLTLTGSSTIYVNCVEVISSTLSPLVLSLSYDVHYNLGDAVSVAVFSNYVGGDGTITLKQFSAIGNPTIGTFYSIVRITQ
jgi:hypothetical protein